MKKFLPLFALTLLGTSAAQAGWMFGFSPFGDQILSVTTTDGVFNIQAFDTGWYTSTGLHDPLNPNYIICEANTLGCGLLDEFRDFFAFRLGTITGNFLSATLSVGNPGGGYNGPAGGLVVGLWDFTGDIDDLLNGTGGVGAFTDLGSGVSYGNRAVTAADDATQVVFNLNAAALAAIQAALNSSGGPGLFVIGGSITGEVPEPGTFLSLGAGLLAVAVLRRRR
jgi:hypothetical protein